MEKEVWKDIEGYEGYYQISSFGVVRGVDRYVDGRTYKGHIKKFVKGRIIKIKTSVHGYYFVTLSKKGKLNNYYIHRLVAISFIDNLKNKKCVNHISGNKKDNRVNNLEWVTHKENTNHAIRIGLINNNGENANWSKLSKDEVLEIKKLLKTKLFSTYLLADIFKVSQSSIHQISKGFTWKNVK